MLADQISKKGGSCPDGTTPFQFCLERPARFERATYGFEVRISEFSNILICLQSFVIIRNLVCTFYLIFINFSIFYKFFSHRDPMETLER